MRALIVDDDEFSLELLGDVLKQLGHEVERAADGAEALEKLRLGNIHLVITDWEMPRMNGLELCRKIRTGDFAGYVFIIMLTGRDSGQQKIEAQHAGADSFLIKPLNPDELLVTLKTAERVLGLETRDLAIFALAKLSESRDGDSGNHIERVQSYARLLAQYLSSTERYHDAIDPEFIRLIYQTSPLHDIGKVGIPDKVLLKPGKLTEHEMAIMRTHVALGAQTLDASLHRFPGVGFLQMARDIAASHHEHWDGGGYPNALQGQDIPLAARIVAVADVYDAITSKRVYRAAMSHAQAKLLIVRERGSHFDPDVVDAFVATERQILAIKAQWADEEGADEASADEFAGIVTEGVNKIMIVDDDLMSLEILSGMLGSLGFESVSYRDGASALAELAVHRPRLIISDWNMPGMDGLELCRRVRVRSGDRHVQFILQTIHAAREQLCTAFDAGVDDFIKKPLDASELMARLRAGLRVIELHDELSRQNEGSQRLNLQLTGLNHRLQKLAITDELTGLYNRRQATHRLEEHWSMCERYQRPIAIITLDIDYFKRVNDVYGHEAGDIVLRGVADVLRQCVRETDLVSRFGGEEFLIILPCQTLHEAEICAQRCRQTIEKKAFQCGPTALHVTISAGIATRRPGVEQWAELLKDADNALYLAKNTGRNTVRVALPLPRPPGSATSAA